ncbi:MAG: peptidase E [Lachnospiraceae bacterium]
MLLLCSNGLTSVTLGKCISDKLDKGIAALVVTADNEYKSENYHVPRCKEELESLGFEVDIFDVDFQPVDDLLKYDIVEFIGGNPYYLLQSLKRCDARDVLLSLSKEKILIGWSAGALVMGPTIGIIEEYSPEMNICKLNDLTGMCLTDVQVLPHYKKFIKKYNNCEEKCLAYEQKNKCHVIRINDGEGVLIDDKGTFVI